MVICDACSHKHGCGCESTRDEYNAKASIVLYTCSRCNNRSATVAVDLAGYKLKYSVNPEKIKEWIERKIIASTVNAARPTSESVEIN